MSSTTPNSINSTEYPTDSIDYRTTDGFNMRLIAQGAESRVYVKQIPINATEYAKYKQHCTQYKLDINEITPAGSTENGKNMNSECIVQCVIKQRFQKKYRHPLLDTKLNTTHSRNELRAIDKLIQYYNVHRNNPSTTKHTYNLHQFVVPYVFNVPYTNTHQYTICMQYLTQFTTLKQYIDSLNNSTQYNTLYTVCQQLGELLSWIHSIGIIHGDLTTSNIMIESGSTSPRLTLIDYGLSSISHTVENKSVDLYVLQRTFNASHPHIAEQSFISVLKGYRTHDNDKVLSRLAVVQQRGRKRSMVG